MEKKGDLSHFERGMVVGARRAGLSISETADLLGFSHTTTSTVYREWSEKEKISVSGSCVDENALLMSEVKGDSRLVRDDRKVTKPKITTFDN